jgi:hypothetical protein
MFTAKYKFRVMVFNAIISSNESRKQFVLKTNFIIVIFFFSIVIASGVVVVVLVIVVSIGVVRIRKKR